MPDPASTANDRVRITDVAPRDGLQNEPRAIPTAEKIELAKACILSGVDEVEVSSFVSPKWIPQLGDAAEVFDGLARWLAADAPAEARRVMLSALVPNEKGMQALLEVNRRAAEEHGVERLIGKASVFTAASETFSLKNTNGSIGETIERFRPVIAIAAANNLLVRGYVSCAFGCPFEGEVSPDSVSAVAGLLIRAGVSEIDLGDTIGAAEPGTAARVLDPVREEVERGSRRELPVQQGGLTLHLHDTRGLAAEVVAVALECGIRSFDGAAGGLGGCPYASTPERRAPGNIDTALLVQVIRAVGHACGVNSPGLAEAGRVAQQVRSGTGTAADAGGAGGAA